MNKTNFTLKVPFIPESLTKYSSRSTIHETIRYQLFRLAYNKDYFPLAEVKTKNGKIDVGWFQKNVCVALFEIDFSFKPNSLKKLNETEAIEKYWIVIKKGKKQPINLPKNINLIRLIK